MKTQCDQLTGDNLVEKPVYSTMTGSILHSTINLYTHHRYCKWLSFRLPCLDEDVYLKDINFFNNSWNQENLLKLMYKYGVKIQQLF